MDELGKFPHGDAGVRLEVLLEEILDVLLLNGAAVEAVAMVEGEILQQMLPQLTFGGEDDALEGDVVAADLVAGIFGRLEVRRDGEGADAVEVDAAAIGQLRLNVFADCGKGCGNVGPREGGGVFVAVHHVFGGVLRGMDKPRMNGPAAVGERRTLVGVEISCHDDLFYGLVVDIEVYSRVIFSALDCF